MAAMNLQVEAGIEDGIHKVQRRAQRRLGMDMAKYSSLEDGQLAALRYGNSHWSRVDMHHTREPQEQALLRDRGCSTGRGARGVEEQWDGLLSLARAVEVPVW